MISTVLANHPWLSTLALVVAVVGGTALAWATVLRPRAAAVLAALACVPVVVLTLVPSGSPAYPGCYVGFSVPTLGRVELMANITLFIAPTVLAGVATRRPLRVLLVATVVSALIEAVQSVVTGLGRSCDTNDWMCNTIGAVVGSALAVVVLTLARRREPG